jgi:biofilm PGA synthesis N-glycosyltransferase PgaC
MKQYAAITPARDEQEFLPGLITSMAAQTHRPLRWVIIDDGSRDATAGILDYAALEFPWITVHHLPPGRVREAGGESLIKRFLLPDLWRDCEAIFRVDADISFGPDCMELLLAELDCDPKLGIAGATLYEPKREGWQEVWGPAFHTRGATKLYSRACLEAIGGLEAGLGWDTIDEMRAASLGFKTRSFRHIHARHHRPQGSALGLLRGRLSAGRAAYQSGYSPVFMAARALRQAAAWPPVIGALMLLAGYVECYIRRPPRLASPELVKFVRRQQMRRLLRMETTWR